MSRPLRLEFPDALYHLTSRGDRREWIYEDDEDRQLWLQVLEECCERFDWQVLAYCLMSNHYHLLARTRLGNLSQGMRHLNGVYTQRSNRRYGRSGHVFQGRFKAVLVDEEAYLLEVARYVVLNPVRAGMVAEVGQWPWSSYAATVGLSEAPPWLDRRRAMAGNGVRSCSGARGQWGQVLHLQIPCAEPIRMNAAET